jgi:hypothetical protein
MRTILQESSRVGETKFVDADKLTRHPVRLHLVDVPEATALRILLRQATGYIANPRAERTHEASRFHHVIVIAANRRPASSSYTPLLESRAPGPIPAQREPTSVQSLNPDSSLDESTMMRLKSSGNYSRSRLVLSTALPDPATTSSETPPRRVQAESWRHPTMNLRCSSVAHQPQVQDYPRSVARFSNRRSGSPPSR